ncbi:MAG TPA: DsbC family protein [Syntrophales bacterium]|nr:DsbC family protein [Syntrophales bacterium]
MIKKDLFLIIVSLLCTLLITAIYSEYGLTFGIDNNQGKNGCVTLGRQGIKDILTKLNAPEAKVLSITESPIEGFCEVAIDNTGRIGVFYLALDKKFMIFGSLVEVDNMSNKTQESIRGFQDKKRIDIAKIPLDNALIMGSSDASKKVVVFTDPDCPYCGQLHQTMKQIVAKRKDIAFYIKFFPLVFHKDAYWKAKSIVCNKSLKMLEDNFEKKEIPKTECTTDEIDNSIKLASSFGISGTPALILPDGRLREGAMPEAELVEFIDGKK